MTNPTAASNHFRDVTHAIVRASYAADLIDLHTAIAPVGLTVTTQDWGAGFPQSRWTAVITRADGAEVLTVVNVDELNAAKHAAYNALLVMQQTALLAIEGEAQP